jgi:hypothetical protein
MTEIIPPFIENSIKDQVDKQTYIDDSEKILDDAIKTHLSGINDIGPPYRIILFNTIKNKKESTHIFIYNFIKFISGVDIYKKNNKVFTYFQYFLNDDFIKLFASKVNQELTKMDYMTIFNSFLSLHWRICVDTYLNGIFNFNKFKFNKPLILEIFRNKKKYAFLLNIEKYIHTTDTDEEDFRYEFHHLKDYLNKENLNPENFLRDSSDFRFRKIFTDFFVEGEKTINQPSTSLPSATSPKPQPIPLDTSSSSSDPQPQPIPSDPSASSSYLKSFPFPPPPQSKRNIIIYI